MELRWVEAFVAVAEELHFGRAAGRLQMAQSPLSQTIRKLEKDLGVPLFERNTRSVALTAAGHAFLPHARTLLQEVETSRSATRASVGRVYGRVALGFSGVVNHLSLPPLTRAVRERHPDLTLELVGRVMTQDAVEQLSSGRLDIAFVGLPVESSALATRLIAREALGVVVPVDHPVARLDGVALTELSGEGFVSTPESSGSMLQECALRACLEAGFRPRIVQEISDPYMVLMLVAAGLGVAITTEGMSVVLPPGARYVPLRGVDVTMDHGIAWARGRGSRARAAVLEVATDVLRDLDSGGAPP